MDSCYSGGWSERYKQKYFNEDDNIQINASCKAVQLSYSDHNGGLFLNYYLSVNGICKSCFDKKDI
jgi:hypothetical protein